LIVIAAGTSVSAETRKPIYRIRRYCKATSEYSPIRSIGLTLINNKQNEQNNYCNNSDQDVTDKKQDAYKIRCPAISWNACRYGNTTVNKNICHIYVIECQWKLKWFWFKMKVKD